MFTGKQEEINGSETDEKVDFKKGKRRTKLHILIWQKSDRKRPNYTKNRDKKNTISPLKWWEALRCPISHQCAMHVAGLQEGLEKPTGMGSRQNPRWSLPGSREDQEDTLNKGNVIKVRSWTFLNGSHVPRGLCPVLHPSPGSWWSHCSWRC